MSIDYAILSPEIKVAGAACFLLVLDLGFRGRWRFFAWVISLAALFGSLLDVIGMIGATPRVTLSGMFVLDGFALAFKGLFLVSAILAVLVSIGYMQGHRYEGEYYFLLMCSVLGTLLMPSSRDLLTLFISLELVSAPAFVLAGIRKQDPRSNEAALKFFLFGVISAGVLVYGISLVYGFAHSTNLYAIAAQLKDGPKPAPLLMGGLMLIVAAFGFKISAVPFHFWAPDTYEGSPPPLAAFLSVASKAAGFAGLALILIIAFPASADVWGPVIGVLAILTMTVGNVMALKQRHLVRLLAYSSIAHAGYMLIPLAVIRPAEGGVAANTSEVVSGLLVYLVMYMFMNMGAFGLAAGLSKQQPTLLVRELGGLGRRAPMYALGLAAFMISLGGIPPFAGWFAKFFIFKSAVSSGGRLGLVLATAMVLNSVVSLYYYLAVVRTMFLGEAREEPEALRFAPSTALAVGVCTLAVVGLGVYPQIVASIGQAATVALP